MFIESVKQLSTSYTRFSPKETLTCLANKNCLLVCFLSDIILFSLHVRVCVGMFVRVCVICCSKLDEDNLYMAYADIMAKVSDRSCNPESTLDFGYFLRNFRSVI